MSSHPHAEGDLANENVHHEESDINVRAIITFVVVLTAITIGIQILVYGIFVLFNKIEDKTQPETTPLLRQAAQPETFPEPRLQTTPWMDLKKLRADENTFLHSYGWVDESAGIARVPIDKAKAMLLQKGLPVRADAVTDASEGTHVAAMGESNSGRTLPGGQADTSSGSAAAPSTGASPTATPGGGGNPPTAGPTGAPAGAAGGAQAGQPTSAKPLKKKPGGGA